MCLVLSRVDVDGAAVWLVAPWCLPRRPRLSGASLHRPPFPAQQLIRPQVQCAAGSLQGSGRLWSKIA